MVDIDPQIFGNYDNTIKYDPIRIAFVGGVFDG